MRDLKWFDPRGRDLAQDGRIYSEELREDSVTALFIKRVVEEDAGLYTCSATYASNQEITAEVEVFVFVGINWEDAPEEQFGVRGQDHKVRRGISGNHSVCV